MSEVIKVSVELSSGDSFAEPSLSVLQAKANVLLDST